MPVMLVILVKRAGVPQVPYADVAEWWDLCSEVVLACCRSIAQQVENVQCRSQFRRSVVWTEYDALMLGRFDETSLHASCFDTLLACTKSRGVGWCRRVALRVTGAATTALHAHLAEHGPHFCTAGLLCPCIQQISRRMQCSVTALLVEAAFQKLMTGSFVYSDDEILWPRSMLSDIRTAVCMGQHTRLGRGSFLLLLDRDTLAYITGLAGIAGIAGIQP